MGSKGAQVQIKKQCPATDVPKPQQVIPKCKSHNKPIILCCETCDYLLLCVECVNVEHIDHTFKSTAELAAKQRINLAKCLGTAKDDSRNFSSVIQTISEKKALNVEQKQNVVDSIAKQKNKLIVEIQRIASDLEDKSSKIYETNLTILKSLEKEVCAAFEKRNKGISECENVLELPPSSSSDLILLTQYEDLMSRLGNISSKGFVVCTTEQVFNASSLSNDDELLPSLFGNLKTSVDDGKVFVFERNKSSRDDTKRHLPFEDHETSTAQETLCFRLQPNVCCMATNSRNKSWINHLSENKQYTDTLELVNQTGKIETTLKLKIPISDITTSSNGSVFVCRCDGSIFEILPDDTPKFLFKTMEDPTGICMTNDDHVVVCFFAIEKVIKFTKDGQVIQEIDSSSTLYLEQAGLFSFLQYSYTNLTIKKPHKLAADKTSNTLAVTEKSEDILIIMNTDFNIKYLFNGSLSYMPGQNQNETRIARFSPNNICFDGKGNILIANGLGSRTILFLNKAGQNIKILLSEPHAETIYCINVDTNGRIWSGFKSGMVKILKYDEE